MPKKKITPLKLTRASEKAYAKAIADAGEEVAMKQNDPAAIVEAARRKVVSTVDKQAEVNPATASIVRFSKHGNFRRF
jgi:hypothetical protein